jgi:hypothetical protein
VEGVFSEDEMRRPTPCAVPLEGLQMLVTGSKRPTMERRIGP